MHFLSSALQFPSVMHSTQIPASLHILVLFSHESPTRGRCRQIEFSHSASLHSLDGQSSAAKHRHWLLVAGSQVPKSCSRLLSLISNNESILHPKALMTQQPIAKIRAPQTCWRWCRRAFMFKNSLVMRIPRGRWQCSFLARYRA